MLLKTKLMLVGGSALALLLFGSSSASASGGGGGGGGGGPGPGPLPNPTPAPQGQKASVVPNALGGMVMRSEPSTRGGAATITSRSAVNGATVTVLETGIPDADGVTGGEWWRIVGPDGTVGYSRGIDPQGVHNFQLLA